MTTIKMHGTVPRATSGRESEPMRARRPHYATDATGSRAHWIEGARSKRAAVETAQTRVTNRGDSAHVYRVTTDAPGSLVYRCWRDAQGFQWMEYAPCRA